MLMGKRKRITASGRDAQCLPRWQARRMRASQPLAECFAVKQFHRDEPCSAIAVEVVELHDVRVHKRLSLAEFPPEPGDGLGSIAQFRAQRLDRNV